MIGLGLHTLGGFLTIPSVFGWSMVSKSTASSLACLGILLEMGYGAWALLQLLYFRLVREKEGSTKLVYPKHLVLSMIVRHSLACGMGIPMVFWYRNNPDLHRLCYYLQFSSAAIGCITEYSRKLDIAKSDELFQFTLLSLVMFLIVVWARVVQWVFLSYKLVKVVYADKHWTLLVFGGLFLAVFTAFNIIGAVIPTYQRLVKFWNELAAYGCLPEDVDEHTRRIGSNDMQAAAKELINQMGAYSCLLQDMDEQIRRISFDDRNSTAAALMALEATFYESLFECRLIKKRHTFEVPTTTGTERLPVSDYDRATMVSWRDVPSDRLKKKKTQNNDNGKSD